MNNEFVYYDPTQIELLRSMTRGQKNLHMMFARHMDENNTIKVEEHIKDVILSVLEMKESTYRTTISELHKKDVIRILGRNMYMVNPSLVFQYKISEQEELICKYKKAEKG